jgi:competence protein ComEA
MADPTVGNRVAAVWRRIRSGEDPLAFGAVVVVLGLVAGGLWFWVGAHHGGLPAAAASPPPSGEPVDSGGKPTPSGAGATIAGPGGVGATTGPSMAVHVAGAVAHPGLYHFNAGSRVADALARAGGSLPRADLDRLNLAARLVDGQKVYVACRGEPGPPDPASVGVADGGGGDGTGATPSEPVDLNTAGLAALDSLPGVGPATARAILEERARRGGFRSPRDLLRIPGIGEGRFARLKDHVRV